MTLARKLAIKIAAVVLGLAMVGLAAVWGLLGLRSHFDAAEGRYQQLRTVYEVGHEAAAARMLLESDPGETETARQHVHRAMRQARRLLQEPGHGPPLAAEQRAALRTITDRLGEAWDRSGEPSAQRQRAAINAALGRVAELADRINHRIVTNRRAATARLRWTVGLLAGLSLLTVAGAVVLGLNIHRSVARPLSRLERGVNQAAEADFTRRLPVEGDREFTRLAERFNAMSDELDRLYRGLEAEVEAKSRQLVRSERLASIGHLAAGFAHEINNPLAIMTGYAEAALRRRSNTDASADGDGRAEKALRVVCEEADRCKQITDRLLQLARAEETPHRPLDLAELTQQTTRRMRRMPEAEHRSLECETPPAAVHVEGDEAELTQLVTNLIANALQATPDGGHVRIRLERDGGWARLRVEDNGRGIDAQALGAVFEPFYTDRPEPERRGVGLGLSLVHAIAERHGGRVDVESPGPGRGSVFLVRLPVATARSEVSSVVSSPPSRQAEQRHG